MVPVCLPCVGRLLVWQAGSTIWLSGVIGILTISPPDPKREALVVCLFFYIASLLHSK